MRNKHTPSFYIEKGEKRINTTALIIRSDDGLGPVAFSTKKYADFIVQACNSHEELIELIEQAFDRFTDNDMMPPNYELSTWLKKTEEALTKVKEV